MSKTKSYYIRGTHPNGMIYECYLVSKTAKNKKVKEWKKEGFKRIHDVPVMTTADIEALR
jgi:hypothetical protein